MKNVVTKIVASGNANVLLTERGSSFGYNTLVTDMRGLPIMAETGCPVIFDATHSVQQPGGQGTSSGGDRRFVPVLARAAVAVGVAGVFIETHEDPDRAPSDGPNMVPLKDFGALMAELMAIDARRQKTKERGQRHALLVKSAGFGCSPLSRWTGTSLPSTAGHRRSHRRSAAPMLLAGDGDASARAAHRPGVIGDPIERGDAHGGDEVGDCIEARQHP